MSNGRTAQTIELAVPGMLVGLMCGVVAGGLAAVVGQPADWAAITALSLGVPLALLGGGYGLLLANGLVRIGGFAPAALYWLVGFPLARFLHEVLTRLFITGEFGLPEDVLGFLAYQGIISAGFAIGFLWMHERLAPRWWYRVSPHNERAAEVFARYAAHASTFQKAPKVQKAEKPPKARRR